jgi:hypothetical protein
MTKRQFHLVESDSLGDIDTLALSQRDLEAVVSAMRIARDQTINGHNWVWWNRTKYVDRLYHSLKRIADN